MIDIFINYNKGYVYELNDKKLFEHLSKDFDLSDFIKVKFTSLILSDDFPEELKDVIINDLIQMSNLIVDYERVYTLLALSEEFIMYKIHDDGKIYFAFTD